MCIFLKKDQLHNVNILDVIESDKCGYLNARKLLFKNTLGESTCSLVPKNVEIYAAALLFHISNNPRQIELENISVHHIGNLRTVS